jgi:MYXO-CTERM domain-containing protein
MVAAGTGSTVGITLWVVASGRYEPMNKFTISASQLTWDWSTSQSDYVTVRTQAEAMNGFAAWQIESSLSLLLVQVERALINGVTGAGVSVLDAGSQYLPVYGDGGADAGDSGIIETADQVRMADLATCFPGGNTSSTRVTRMRADLNQSALANDLVLQAANDQGTLSNYYQVTNSINAPKCPTYAPLSCPACGSSSGGGPYGYGYGDDGGGAAAPAGPTAGGSGCSSAAPSGDAATLWPELTLLGLLGAAVWRARRKRS